MIVLAIILALLILLLLLPVGVDASFLGGALTVKVKAGPVKLRLIPARKKKEKPGKEKKKKAKPPKEKKAPEEKKKQKLTRDDIFGIARLGLKALSRLRKSLSIDLLMLHLTAGAEDPYDAVMQYGYVNAGLGALLPLLHRAVKVRKEDIATAVDLNSGKTSVDLRLAATLQIWEILYIALCAGVGFLGWMHKRKKRAKQETAVPANTCS